MKTYSVASVTVSGAINGVQPTPVGIKHNRAFLLGASATSSTLLPGQGRVGFRRQSSSLLGLDGSPKGGEEKCTLMHCECSIERENRLN